MRQVLVTASARSPSFQLWDRLLQASLKMHRVDNTLSDRGKSAIYANWIKRVATHFRNNLR